MKVFFKNVADTEVWHLKRKTVSETEKGNASEEMKVIRRVKC